MPRSWLNVCRELAEASLLTSHLVQDCDWLEMQRWCPTGVSAAVACILAKALLFARIEKTPMHCAGDREANHFQAFGRELRKAYTCGSKARWHGASAALLLFCCCPAGAQDDPRVVSDTLLQVAAGVAADGRQIVNRAMEECTNYKE
jgi:hypothetical protein